MRHERQVELLQRVVDAGEHLRGLHAPASITNKASAYTDPERFEREMRLLFREGPAFFAMSCELREPGSYRAATVAGVPLVVVRQPDGSLRALVNICRHRGAPLLPSGTAGEGLRTMTCPYHGWVYGADGALRSQPHSGGAFDDVPFRCDLHRVPVAERYGLIFVRPTGTDPIDVDAYLGGAQDDLGAFGLDGYVHIETRSATWRMNWKLVLDTFTESYHIRTLHRESLLPRFNSDCTIFESYGRNVLSIGLRKDVLDEARKPREEWSILPYGTIQYFLVPSGLVVHQLDHVETWRIEPIDVRTSVLTTSVFSPTAPQSERQHGYFVKNLDLLLSVTGTEDFPLMERIQANLDSGGLAEVVYGRNEPPLVAYHQAVNAAVGD